MKVIRPEKERERDATKEKRPRVSVIKVPGKKDRRDKKLRAKME